MRDIAVGALIGVIAFIFGLGFVIYVHDSMLIKDCDQYGMTRLDGKVYHCQRKEQEASR
jgi:hypothetical protein